MRKHIGFATLLVAGFLVGCGARPPVTLDGAKSVTVSQGLVTGQSFKIGKDAFLDKNSWSYGLYFTPEKSITNDANAIIPDHMKIKVFYLGHHADVIVLNGNNRSSCSKVVKYLQSEGVTSTIHNNCKGHVRDRGEQIYVAMTFAKGDKGLKDIDYLLKDKQ